VGRTPWSAADAHVGLLGKAGPGTCAVSIAIGNTLACSIDILVDVRPTPRRVSAQQT